MVSPLEPSIDAVLDEAWYGVAQEHWAVDEHVFGMGLNGRDGQIAESRHLRRRSGREDALVGGYQG